MTINNHFGPQSNNLWKNIKTLPKQSNNYSDVFSLVQARLVFVLSAFVTAFPHSVPPLVPSLLAHLGSLLHDQQPIPATVKKTLQSFKRTHQDNWAEHKAAFTEDQLTELTNLLVSPRCWRGDTLTSRWIQLILGTLPLVVSATTPDAVGLSFDGNIETFSGVDDMKDISFES